MRYIEVKDYYVPDLWRKQSEDNKQASNGAVSNQEQSNALYDAAMFALMETYETLIATGVAKEQARIILPLSVYTEVYWTASFQAIMNFLELRLHEHAQWEIQQYAQEILKVMEQMFPVTTKIWVKETKK